MAWWGSVHEDLVTRHCVDAQPGQVNGFNEPHCTVNINYIAPKSLMSHRFMSKLWGFRQKRIEAVRDKSKCLLIPVGALSIVSLLS